MCECLWRCWLYISYICLTVGSFGCEMTVLKEHALHVGIRVCELSRNIIYPEWHDSCSPKWFRQSEKTEIDI